jgi:hypothetical protein
MLKIGQNEDSGEEEKRKERKKKERRGRKKESTYLCTFPISLTTLSKS